MNQPEFGQAMSDFVNSFPGKNFSTSQTQLIFNKAKELNKSQFEKILRHFILDAKFPSPATLITAVIIERTKNRSWEENQTQYKLLCEDCADTGFLFVREQSIPEPLLMRCYCPNGASNEDFESIPQWNKAIGQIYDKQKFPIEGFKPNGGLETFVKKLSLSEPIKILERWQARKKLSNDFWKYQIDNQKTQTTEGSNV
mgnify:CR=1 FL=1